MVLSQFLNLEFWWGKEENVAYFLREVGIAWLLPLFRYLAMMKSCSLCLSISFSIIPPSFVPLRLERKEFLMWVKRVINNTWRSKGAIVEKRRQRGWNEFTTHFSDACLCEIQRNSFETRNIRIGIKRGGSTPISRFSILIWCPPVFPTSLFRHIAQPSSPFRSALLFYCTLQLRTSVWYPRGKKETVQQ